jgi:hypothetical protein
MIGTPAVPIRQWAKTQLAIAKLTGVKTDGSPDDAAAI